VGLVGRVTRRLAAVAVVTPVTLFAAWQAAGYLTADLFTRIVTMVPILAVPFVVTVLWIGLRGAYSAPRIRPVPARGHLAVVPALPDRPTVIHATVTDLPPVRQEIGAR
jgi:hypothetical protein